jgi:hypothetical protein
MRSITDGCPFAAAAIAVLMPLALGGCGQSEQKASSLSPPARKSAALSTIRSSTETPVPPEVNPPGDIPDSQVFIEYASPSGYALEVPEGWARVVRGPDVTFTDKLDGLSVSVPRSPETLATIEAAAHAGSDFKRKDVTLPIGPAIEVTYSSNSEPDQVTGKKIRLANEAVIFVHGARHATLRVWAPFGADNVDQWHAIERSFRFR